MSKMSNIYIILSTNLENQERLSTIKINHNILVFFFKSFESFIFFTLVLCSHNKHFYKSLLVLNYCVKFASITAAVPIEV